MKTVNQTVPFYNSVGLAQFFFKNTFRIDKNRNIAFDFDLKSKVLHNILK